MARTASASCIVRSQSSSNAVGVRRAGLGGPALYVKPYPGGPWAKAAEAAAAKL